MTERAYTMTRVSAGDYLLPSNDGQILWRICRGDETDGDENERLTTVWQVWKWRGDWVGQPTMVVDDFDNWDRWALMATWLKTRGEAIETALSYYDSSPQAPSQ